MRTFLIALFVVATVGVCHGLFNLSPDEQKLFDRLFETGQEPMTVQETIDGLKEIMRVADNLWLKKHAAMFLRAADFEANKCTNKFISGLEDTFYYYKHGSSGAGSGIINAAAMVEAQIEPLKQFCIEEYKKRFAEAKQAGYMENNNDMNEILKSVDHAPTTTNMALWPISHLWTSIAKYVENKAGKENLHKKHLLKDSEPSEKKYGAAYNKYVVEPCNKFKSTLGPVAKIGTFLEDILPEELQKEGSNLFKQWQICAYADLNKESFDDYIRLARREKHEEEDRLKWAQA